MKPLKQIMKERPFIMLGVHSMSPIFMDLFLQCNPDVIMIDCEHTPQTVEDCYELIATAKSLGVPCAIRIPRIDEVEIRKAYEMGAQVVVVPHIKNKQDAVTAVQGARFPTYPGGENRYNGKRSYDSNVRGAYYGGRHYDPDTYLNECEAEQLLVFTCEDIEFIENIDEIFDVKGFDGVVVGPYDFGQSEHHPKFQNVDLSVRPDLQNVHKKIREKCRETGRFTTVVPLATPMPEDPDELAAMITDTVGRQMHLGFDTHTIMNAADTLSREIIEKFR